MNKKKLILNILLFTVLIAVLAVLVILTIGEINNGDNTFGEDANFNDGNDNFSNNSGEVSYSANTTIDEDTTITSGTYSSSESLENAILVTGSVTANISNVEVTKTGDADTGDEASFYGNNSAILAKDGATLYLDNITVTTDATGANGVFSYGGSATTDNTSSDGTIVYISNSTITTYQNNSGGIMATGGGYLYATNLIVRTSGISSAAIRTDRGGGVVEVQGGEYTTSGAGSPAVYSTADVTVKDATLTSLVAEGIVIEGKNSVVLENSTLTSSNTELNGLSTTYKNIFLYQSMSGDAAVGSSSFTASNSTITTNNGDTIYVTNTTAEITLINNTIVNNDSTGNFLRIQKDSWGSEGSNGGDVILLLSNQSVSGNIVVDEISTLDMTLEDNSYYEGTINGDNTAESISLTLDATSKIKLTGDSYLTSLTTDDLTYSNIDFNGYTLYVNGVAIN